MILFILNIIALLILSIGAYSYMKQEGKKGWLLVAGIGIGLNICSILLYIATH